MHVNDMLSQAEIVVAHPVAIESALKLMHFLSAPVHNADSGMHCRPKDTEAAIEAPATKKAITIPAYRIVLDGKMRQYRWRIENFTGGRHIGYIIIQPTEDCMNFWMSTIRMMWSPSPACVDQ